MTGACAKRSKAYTRLLTIAGSDSGGGAGIQADLKTFAACGCYGMSAVTAITAQNTREVIAISAVPVPMIQAQIRAIFDDIGVDAIKIGMLHSAEVVAGLVDVFAAYDLPPLVLDPVMVATSGDLLLQKDAVAALQSQLFPMVSLLTPNIPEAALLLGRSALEEDELVEAAQELSRIFRVAVLLKAGHLTVDSLQDVLVAGPDSPPQFFSNPRLATRNTHGTGCTLSSAIAAYLGKGYALADAVSQAEQYLYGAIASGAEYQLGGGHGPVHHFHRYW